MIFRWKSHLNCAVFVLNITLSTNLIFRVLNSQIQFAWERDEISQPHVLLNMIRKCVKNSRSSIVVTYFNCFSSIRWFNLCYVQPLTVYLFLCFCECVGVTQRHFVFDEWMIILMQSRNSVLMQTVTRFTAFFFSLNKSHMLLLCILSDTKLWAINKNTIAMCVPNKLGPNLNLHIFTVMKYTSRRCVNNISNVML